MDVIENDTELDTSTEDYIDGHACVLAVVTRMSLASKYEFCSHSPKNPEELPFLTGIADAMVEVRKKLEDQYPKMFTAIKVKP